jgi:hypothetical protein
MSDGIVYPKQDNPDFDKEMFEAGLRSSFSDFAFFLNTGDKSKFRPFKKALGEWKTLADEVKRETAGGNYGSEHPRD